MKSERIRGSGLYWVLIVLFSPVLFPQAKAPITKVVKLETLKPSIYIEYVRTGPRTPLHTDESGKGVWLRLHNNTSLTIVVPAFEVPKANGDAGLYYDVRAIRGSTISNPPMGEHLSHMQSLSTIRPGSSLEFSVPAEHLQLGLEIAVYFNYEWENPALVLAAIEPEHRLVFELKTSEVK